jgi:hypothetical protein
LSIVLDNYVTIIVLGDFNIHVDKETDIHVDKENDSKTIECIHLLSSMDFIQHVTGPTHNRGHTLGLVITKGLSIDISSIVDVALSDQHCVFLQPCCP